jgi:inward rectifier potassium channel
MGAAAQTGERGVAMDRPETPEGEEAVVEPAEEHGPEFEELPATPNPRLNAASFLRTNRRDVIVVGRDRLGWNDLYHRVLTMPLWGLLVLLASVFIGANVIFAALYMLQPGAIAGAKAGSFWDAFFFSVQTLGTVGYGVMTPKTLYANLLSTVETFCNLVIVALSTGLIFTRVSRPTARVMFSRVAVVTNYDGVPTLMFRAANQRGNQILEAEVTVSLARQVTTVEGHTMRHFQPLHVVRSRSPLFVLSWQVMHPIDDASPLNGVTPEAMAAMGGEIIVAISGVDDTFAQRIHARHSYLPDEIVWGKRFDDMLSVNNEGRRIVDYNRFHDVREP